MFECFVKALAHDKSSKLLRITVFFIEYINHLPSGDEMKGEAKERVVLGFGEYTF
jgi:hypothetical protein